MIVRCVNESMNGGSVFGCGDGGFEKLIEVVSRAEG